VRNKFNPKVRTLMKRAADARINSRLKKNRKAAEHAAAGRWRAEEARSRQGRGR